MPKLQKICSVCGSVFDISDFIKKKSICKTCYAAKYRAMRQQKKQQIIEEKEIELKNSLASDYLVMEEENKRLKEKLIVIESIVKKEELDTVIEAHKILQSFNTKLSKVAEVLDSPEHDS
jgi:hypothetical protein